MSQDSDRPDFQVVVRKTISSLATSETQKANFWESATMLEDGTINLQFARYYPEGEIVEGFAMRRPGSSGYQDILNRHTTLKPKETSFLQRFPSGRTIVSCCDSTPGNVVD
jgi:hypothetical protein